MGKKAEKLRRMVNKMAIRYGADDPDVLRLQSELDALDAFDFRYPEKFEAKARGREFRTSARQLFYANASKSTQSIVKFLARCHCAAPARHQSMHRPK